MCLGHKFILRVLVSSSDCWSLFLSPLFSFPTSYCTFLLLSSPFPNTGWCFLVGPTAVLIIVITAIYQVFTICQALGGEPWLRYLTHSSQPLLVVNERSGSRFIVKLNCFLPWSETDTGRMVREIE
jgi:hypothetical protein